MREWQKLSYNESHAFILSSGTTSIDNINSYSLSSRSLLNNARYVNKRFNIESSDRWLSSLSKYHIGGLSIFARAYLSGSEVIELERSWDPRVFVADLAREDIQYASLVPTQLYDLVVLQVHCPSCVKGIFIGGDFASFDLCQKALDLGWKIITTFGMTEVCSQMASSYFRDIRDGYLEVFDIHKLVECEQGYKVISDSLFTDKITFLAEDKVSIESSGSFVLKDYIDLKVIDKRVYLKPLGRRDDTFKIKGRLYHLNTLKEVTAKSLMQMCIFDKISFAIDKDDRLGSIITVYLLDDLTTQVKEVESLLLDKSGLSKEFFSFKFVAQFEKTLVGKIKHR